MIFGYARVSRPDQQLDLQVNALKEAGCERIFSEKVSGAKNKRKEFDAMLTYLRPGDTLIVWKLDRMARSLPNLIDITKRLRDQNISFKSLKDGVTFDDSAMGKFMLHLMGAIAELERDMMIERTHAGLRAARKKGRKGGRPKGLTKKLKELAPKAKKLYDADVLSITEICETLNLSRASLYKCLRHEGVEFERDSLNNPKEVHENQISKL